MGGGGGFVYVTVELTVCSRSLTTDPPSVNRQVFCYEEERERERARNIHRAG